MEIKSWALMDSPIKDTPSFKVAFRTRIWKGKVHRGDESTEAAKRYFDEISCDFGNGYLEVRHILKDEFEIVRKPPPK